MTVLLKKTMGALCATLCGACIWGCDLSQDRLFRDEAAVRDCHAEWFEGLLDENLQKLDGLLADDVTLSFPNGSLWKKPDLLEALRAGDLQYDSVDEEEALIRLYGRVGVVNGMATLGYTYRGEPDEELLRYTAIYVSSRRGCTMVAWQSTDREAMSELDAFRTQEKTEEQNIETVREFLESIDNGTHAERTDLFSTDYICHFVGAPEPLTLEVQTEFITTAYKSLPDNMHIVKDAFAKGDKVSMRVINQGTQQGEWEGVLPTGKKYAYEAMWIFRLADGKIAEAWGLEDNLGFMQQLGMELKPKEEE